MTCITLSIHIYCIKTENNIVLLTGNTYNT